MFRGQISFEPLIFWKEVRFFQNSLSSVMRKGRMLRRFENFKINEYLYGKPLNRDLVTGGVFPIHSASLQSQFRLLAAGREMSPRCSLKRVDEDSLFQAFR